MQCVPSCCVLCVPHQLLLLVQRRRDSSQQLFHPSDTDKLLLEYISKLKSIISELTARHPILPNITDATGFVESFSRLSVDDQNTNDPEEHLVRQ